MKSTSRRVVPGSSQRINRRSMAHLQRGRCAHSAASYNSYNPSACRVSWLRLQSEALPGYLVHAA
eukprot:6099382-Pyramimonas_sp.AAC.1